MLIGGGIAVFFRKKHYRFHKLRFIYHKNRLYIARGTRSHYNTYMNIFFLIIFANVIISLVSLLGLVTIFSKKLQSKNMVEISVSFAAGVLLSSAFFNILVEALKDRSAHEVFLYTIIGMVFSFFLERFFLWFHHHHEDTHNIHPSALLVIIGDAIHNFIDGLAIAATFIAAPALGITTTLAIAAHEIPQEIADFSILRHSGLSAKRAIQFNFISALTAVIGGIIGFYFFNTFHEVLPLALGFTAGIFIYIASADLIPALHENHSNHKPFIPVLCFLLGILLIYFI